MNFSMSINFHYNRVFWCIRLQYKWWTLYIAKRMENLYFYCSRHALWHLSPWKVMIFTLACSPLIVIRPSQLWNVLCCVCVFWQQNHMREFPMIDFAVKFLFLFQRNFLGGRRWWRKAKLGQMLKRDFLAIKPGTRPYDDPRPAAVAVTLS